MYTVLTSFRTASPASNREALQNNQNRLKNVLQGTCLQEKERKQNSKRIILNFSQGDKIYWFLGSYSTEATKAWRSEIDAVRGNQGPTQPWLAHRAALNTSQGKADPLTQIEMDS